MITTVLTQLNACRSPGDKAAVLVAAHKILVGESSSVRPALTPTDSDYT